MLLNELQASLNRSARQGGSVSLLAERDFDAPSRVSLTQDGSGNPLLQLDSDFDRARSSVGRALQAADVRVDDLDRSLGVYYVNLSERADDPDESLASSAGCSVAHRTRTKSKRVPSAIRCV